MFALIDCNNFFASCEMVFNPKLEKKPLVILSNNDGCVIARSAKAKELGIKMGDPAFQWRGRVEMLSSNFVLYADMSQRVMQVLESFSPDMEVYSIDEAFFEVNEGTDEELREQAKAIRKKVLQWTGIPISVGVAPTKTLAKLASEGAKKEGVCVLRGKAIEERLAVTALDDVWGIGGASMVALKKRGIYTAAQLCGTEDGLIRKWLGVTGYRTVLELRGTPCFQLLEIPEKKKSIVVSRSFGQRVEELPLLEEAVATFAARVGEKLREQESKAQFLSIFLLGEEESFSCHARLPNGTSFTPELIGVAKEGLRKIYRARLKYKKAGVMVGDFTEDDQVDFLTPKKASGKKIGAMEVFDEINARYEKGIRFAAEGVDERATWKSSQANCSPKYTTSWQELLKI